MDMFYVLLVLDSFKWVFLQTCNDLEAHVATNVNKRLVDDENRFSCLSDLNLEHCALECLLVKMCKSFNYIESDTTEHGTMCELNSVNRIGNDHVQWSSKLGSIYADIQNWTTTVAGTCASRPCAENQRCLPTTPYRCIEIDCGSPSVLPVEGDQDTNMYPILANASLGSRAYYTCQERAKTVRWDSNSQFECVAEYRTCNTDSAWSPNDLYCE